MKGQLKLNHILDFLKAETKSSGSEWYHLLCYTRGPLYKIRAWGSLGLASNQAYQGCLAQSCHVLDRACWLGRGTMEGLLAWERLANCGRLAVGAH